MSASEDAFFPAGHIGRKAQAGGLPFTSTFKGKIYPHVWKHSVFWVLGCCIGFGIELIHRVRLTKPGRSWLPVSITVCPYCLIRRSPLRRYLVLNRNGTASQVESTSRNFNPVSIFNELKFVHISTTELHLTIRP